MTLPFTSFFLYTVKFIQYDLFKNLLPSLITYMFSTWLKTELATDEVSTVNVNVENITITNCVCTLPDIV